MGIDSWHKKYVNSLLVKGLRMKRYIWIAVLVSFLSAKMIDAIAVVVNNEPITLYEIEQAKKALGISTQEAVQLLIRKKLELSQIKKLGIEVSDFELEDAIDTYARQKGMDILTLQQLIEQRGLSWEQYKKSFKEQLLRKKLYERIAKQARHPSDEQLKEYYTTHPKEFMVPKSVVVTKYISPAKEVLEKIRQNPMYKPETPLLLQKGEEEIQLNQVNPQFAAMLSSLKEGEFSPILPLQDRFLLLYVQKKKQLHKIPFEEAKAYILNRLASESSTKSIKEYFDKLQASAKIKVIRLPKESE